MPNYQKNMTGALYPNDNKESERHPDFTGYQIIEGKKWRIGAWTKETEQGRFLVLRITEPRPSQQDSRPAPEPSSGVPIPPF